MRRAGFGKSRLSSARSCCPTAALRSLAVGATKGSSRARPWCPRVTYPSRILAWLVCGPRFDPCCLRASLTGQLLTAGESQLAQRGPNGKPPFRIPVYARWRGFQTNRGIRLTQTAPRKSQHRGECVGQSHIRCDMAASEMEKSATSPKKRLDASARL